MNQRRATELPGTPDERTQSQGLNPRLMQATRMLLRARIERSHETVPEDQDPAISGQLDPIDEAIELLNQILNDTPARDDTKPAKTTSKYIKL
uniref:Uncharacterized protein n=1 Tax=Moniliophthora roreri TaxID=221103 RepID=A0A0W0G0B8_MONRR